MLPCGDGFQFYFFSTKTHINDLQLWFDGQSGNNSVDIMVSQEIEKKICIMVVPEVISIFEY